MKLLYAYPLLAVAVFAEDDYTDEYDYDDSDDPEVRGSKKFSGITEMVNANIATAFSYSEISKRLQNYGCHCFPGSTRSAIGHGNAVDELDEACRTLGQCHKCVDIDFGNACDVDWGKYRYTVDGSGAVDCSRNTGCKLAQCLCDAEFAYSVGGFWDDANHNGFFWLQKRNKKIRAKNGMPIMDPAVTCQATLGGVQPDSCCGNAFPNKKPYDSTARDCCALSGTTFNAGFEECCADGSVRNIGAC